MNMQKKEHQLLVNLNGYYNKSLAEMTMYPENPDENLMFMLTWPDVRTLHTGVYAEDSFSVNEKGTLRFSSRLAFLNTVTEPTRPASQTTKPDAKGIAVRWHG